MELLICVRYYSKLDIHILHYIHKLTLYMKAFHFTVCYLLSLYKFKALTFAHYIFKNI